MRHNTPMYCVLATLLTACSTDREARNQTVAATVHATPVIALSLADGAFQAPDTLEAGMVAFRFVNHGDDIHYAHAVRLDSARTVAESLSAYTEAVRTAGPRPTYITRSGGPGGTAPRDTSVVTHTIEPGNYVWICPVDDSTGTPHFARGEARTFVVRARASNAPAVSPPRASAVIRLVDFGFGAGCADHRRAAHVACRQRTPGPA